MIRCSYCTRQMRPDEFRSWLGVCTGCSTPSPDELDPRRIGSVFDDDLQWDRDQIAEMKGLVPE